MASRKTLNKAMSARVVVLVSFLGLLMPSFAGWSRSGGGDFYYEDPAMWSDGVPNATFDWSKSYAGDLNVTLTNDETHSSFMYKAYGTYGDIDQMVFLGRSMTINGTSQVRLGNVIVKNQMFWLGDVTVGYGGSNYKARLSVNDGGSLYTTGQVSLGAWANSDPTVGALYIENGGRVTVDGNALIVGNTKSGILWIEDGGELVLTNKTSGFYTSYRADGYMRMTGGRFLAYPGNTSARLYFNFTNDRGSSYPNQVHISGGEILQLSTVWNSNEIWLGYAYNPRAEFYMEGGSADFPRNIVRIGQFADSNKSATLTLDGTARFQCYILYVGYNEVASASGNVATFNLNGNSILEYTRGIGAGGGDGVSRRINFNGGTLSPYEAGSGHTPGWDASVETVVYPKGGALRTRTHDVTPTASFRRARGYGLSSIACAAGGSNYVSPPIVTISGGSGSNATAIAVLGKNRSVERFVVTCPGEGYAASDTLTVTLNHGSDGSGCVAGEVTLAENTVPTFRKTGGFSWIQRSENAWDGNLRIAEGFLRMADGGSFPNVCALTTAPDGHFYVEKSGTDGVVGHSSVANLTATGGIMYVTAFGTSGGAELSVDSLSLLQGGLFLQPSTNGVSVAVGSSTLADADGNMNGYLYTQTGEGLGYPESFVMKRSANGSLSPADYDVSPEPASGSNWLVPTYMPTGATVPSTLASIKLNISQPNGLSISSAENIELTSGMILQTRPQGHPSRCSVSGGGAFTTRAPGGLFLYGPIYQHQGRSYSQYNPEGQAVCRWWLDHDGQQRSFHVGPFADPDGSTPMAVNVCGGMESRPDIGFVAFLAEDVQSTFSGGLNLINGGVFVKEDGNLGAAGSPVRVFGNSSFGAMTGAALKVSASREFVLAEDCNFMLMPTSAGGLEIAGPINGGGDLLTADYGWAGVNGYPTTLSGTQSGFTGTYWIHGITRIAAPSSAAAIRLADATNGVGTIELSGRFERSPGDGPGEVCWRRNDMMQQGGIRGGFGAYGGDLAVNLGGDGRTLVAGSSYLPSGAVISLNSALSTGTLTFENRIDLNGKDQKIACGTGGTVVLSGGIVDSVGGGRLEIEGDVTFYNFTWNIDPSRYGKEDIPATVGHVYGRAQGTIRLSPEVKGWCVRFVGSKIKIGPSYGNKIYIR